MSAYPFTVVSAETLADVSGAYAAWQASADRERAARFVFRAAVSDARDAGAKLDQIAERLGVTRQAVQKVLREVRRAAEEQDAEARWFERRAADDLAEQNRGLTGRRNCFVCGRIKSRISDPCDYCGDDPVTHNGSRGDFDAAYNGGIR